MSADVFVQAVPLLSFCEVSPHSPLLPEFDSSAPRKLDQHAPPALQSFAQNSELALSADLERAEAQRNYSLRVALLGNKAALRIEGIAKPGVGPRAWRG